MKQAFTLLSLSMVAVVGISQAANAQTANTQTPAQPSVNPHNMWQQQERMVSELQAMGLVDSTTHSQNDHDGIGGGDDEDELYVSSEDEIAQKIQQLSQQAQQKENRLASLAQKLSVTPTVYQNTVVITNNSFGSGFGNNTVGAGLLAVRPISSAYHVTSPFGYRTLMGTTRMHKGVDFGAPIGTPIYATGSGIVTHSGAGTGYGRYVEIDHGNGYITRYAHTSRNLVNVGDRVEVNQHIADVGNEGRSTGPHLHYEVRQNGMAVNPQTYLALAPAR